MREVLLTGAARTPIGDINGALSGMSAVELGKISASTTLQHAIVPKEKIGEVIFGNVLQAGLGQNPARQIAMGCGIRKEVPSFTVNQVCGSGLKAIELAYRLVGSGGAEAVLAGGIESMSGAPYILPSMRSGAKLGERPALDTVISDGLTDVFNNCHMGVTAENIAGKYGITRGEQDAFALESQRKYAEAMEKGLFKAELAPVSVKGRKQEIVIDKDEHPRPGVKIEDLSRLKPAFVKDGSVTAGNSSGINDGAASVMILDGGSVPSSGDGRSSCVKIRGVACCGCEPELMGLGPIFAVRQLLGQQGMTVGDIELWELNEAFAAQSVAVINELKIDMGRINVNGGAIALGHPIGASGARIVVTLMHEMKRRNTALGVASLCVGGGMGLAILLENI